MALSALNYSLTLSPNELLLFIFMFIVTHFFYVLFGFIPARINIEISGIYSLIFVAYFLCLAFKTMIGPLSLLSVTTLYHLTKGIIIVLISMISFHLVIRVIHIAKPEAVGSK